MLSPADQVPPGSADIFDASAIAAELEQAVVRAGGDERDRRQAVSMILKAARTRGLAKAEELLLKDRRGRRCAERLSFMQDEIIRLLFEFAETHLYPAQNPSQAEHMAIVATGGYGRGILAPGSDIDLLFLLPYKQTAWSESIAEAILYCLWDMGLKVGHATRSINECIRQSKADMTVRTAILEARYLVGDQKLFEELMQRFDKEVVRGTAKEFVAAKLAEREERHRRAGQSRYLVEPNVKDGNRETQRRSPLRDIPASSVSNLRQGRRGISALLRTGWNRSEHSSAAASQGARCLRKTPAAGIQVRGFPPATPANSLPRSWASMTIKRAVSSMPIAVLSTSTASAARTSGETLRSRSLLSRSITSSKTSASAILSPFSWCSFQRRSARTSGSRSKNLQLGFGEHDRSNSPPFHHDSAARARALLFGNKNFTHFRNRGQPRGRLRHFSRANLQRHVRPIEENTIFRTCCLLFGSRRSQFDVRFYRELG